MLHVFATVELAEGTRDAFLREFHRVVPAVRGEEGCIAYGAAIDVPTGLAAQPPLREHAVVVVEQWRDLPALEAHLAAPHRTAYRARVKAFVQTTTLHVLAPTGV